MDWQNSYVLEFIELLGSEPVIWNPKHTCYKNRLEICEAWNRIHSVFSLQCTVEDLKKKRNSLMAAYRAHLKKIKDLSAMSLGMDEVHKPSWFAFESMHSYLGPVYENHCTLSTDETMKIEILQSNETDVESGEGSLHDVNTSTKRKIKRQDPLLIKQKYDTCLYPENTSKQRDEIDLFAEILVMKLKKMNKEDKLMLTNDINNLVFKYEMKASSRKKEKASSDDSS